MIETYIKIGALLLVLFALFKGTTTKANEISYDDKKSGGGSGGSSGGSSRGGGYGGRGGGGYGGRGGGGFGGRR